MTTYLYLLYPLLYVLSKVPALTALVECGQHDLMALIDLQQSLCVH